MFFSLTKSSTFIIGPIASILGIIMDAIYNFFSNVLGIESLGITIILFTFLIKLAMLPLTIKQQKSTLAMQKIQPDLKKLQEKYKNKKDPESQKKQQEEVAKLYQENNVNPVGECLPLLIQMPVLFALFYVLRNIPAYINSVKDIYIGVVTNVSTVTGFDTILTTISEAKNNVVKGFDPFNQDKVIDLLATFNSGDWQSLLVSFNEISSQLNPLVDHIRRMNYFLSINLIDKPVPTLNDIFSVGVLIPILSLATQILVTVTSTAKHKGETAVQDQTQKTMMYTMPLITLFFVIQMPAGLGLYWLVSNFFQLGQQVLINKYIIKHEDQVLSKK